MKTVTVLKFICWEKHNYVNDFCATGNNYINIQTIHLQRVILAAQA